MQGLCNGVAENCAPCSSPLRVAEECFQKLLEDLIGQSFEEEDLLGPQNGSGIRAKKVRDNYCRSKEDVGTLGLPRAKSSPTMQAPNVEASLLEGLLEPSVAPGLGWWLLHLVPRPLLFHSVPLARQPNQPKAQCFPSYCPLSL